MSEALSRRQATLLLLLPGFARAQQAQKPELVQCDMIWGKAPHSAYTDLVRFHERWFCVFREGRLPSSPDGALRVLTSLDGSVWEPLAQVALPGSDLREPKLSSTPDRRLLLNAVAVGQQASGVRRQSLIWLSTDGRDWGPPHAIGDPNTALGRISWYLGRAYVMGCSASGAVPLRLYTSADGAEFSILSESIPVPGEPAEASLLFLSGGHSLCLLGREGAQPTAELGKSRSPYRAWTWADLGKSIASPNLIRLPDERFLAAGRIVDETVRTSLCWLDPEQETLTEFFALPSSGDTGYPGVVFHDGLLWVSYYSSHEGKPMVYLARVKLPPAFVKKAPSRLTFGN